MYERYTVTILREAQSSRNIDEPSKENLVFESHWEFWIEIDIGQHQIQVMLWQKYMSLGKFSQKPKNP